MRYLDKLYEKIQEVQNYKICQCFVMKNVYMVVKKKRISERAKTEKKGNERIEMKHLLVYSLSNFNMK